MATINDYFDNIQMAFASYADLYKGINIDDYKIALNNSGMALTQYEQFASAYTVLDSQLSTWEGFSATVFKKNGAEEYTLAIRGTEPL